MSGGFIWKVTGIYQHTPVDTLEYEEAVSFECLVITYDPCGRDVPNLALEMRIGPSDCWDKYSPCIEMMTCLGWAQGRRDDHEDNRQPDAGECPTCHGRGCADCVNEDGGEDR